MDITFKFHKALSGHEWFIVWIEDGKTYDSFHSSRTKAINKMLRLIAPKLHAKDSFEVTYHIP